MTIEMDSDMERDVRSTLQAWADGVDVPYIAEAGVIRRVRARHYRRVTLRAVATVAVLAITAGAVLAQRSGSHGVATAPDTPTAPPNVVLDAPGWLLTYLTDVVQPAAGVVTPTNRGFATRSFRDPTLGFDGPSLSVSVTRLPDGAVSARDTVPGNDQTEQVDVNGSVASLASHDDAVSMNWPTGQLDVAVTGQRLAANVVLVFARGLQIDPNTLAVSAGMLPDGLAAVADTAAIGTVESRYREQQYTNGTRRFQLDLYDGGVGGFEQRVSGDARRNVSVRGTTGALLDYGNGRYRLDWREGWWTWEVDSDGNASLDDFMKVVRALKAVDDSTWRAAVPDGLAVFPDERSTVVDEMLAGMSAPAAFDAGSFRTSTAVVPRQLVLGQLAEAVACSWASSYATAVTAGDETAAAAARAALDGAPQWPALVGHDDVVTAVTAIGAGLDSPDTSSCRPPASAHP